MLRRFESYSLHQCIIQYLYIILSFSCPKKMHNISNYKGSSLFHEDNFSLIDLTLEQLVESNFHIGSKLSKFQQINFSFIFSKRFDLFILNLAYSLYNLRLAVYFVTTMVSRRGKILFFDNNELTQDLVKYIGLTSRQYYINKKWIAGLLTNFKNFYPAVFTGISRHFRFSENKYAGMRYIHRPPNVSCILNITRGSSAFIENFRLGIPTIALVSSDNNISGVTFPIFSNNTSRYTFSTFFFILRAAILNGYKDEIYKFYRKSLKRNLKLHLLNLRSKVVVHDPLLFFIRHSIVKLLFVHKEIFHSFFLFLQANIQNPVFSKVINLFLEDMTYYYDRLVVLLPKNYSAYSLGQEHTFRFNDPKISFDLFKLSDFDRFFRVVVEIFLSTNFSRFFFNFYISLAPICFSLFTIFLMKSNIQKLFFDKYQIFDTDLAFIKSVFKKWISFHANCSFSIGKQFPHEIFPFFIESRNNVNYFSTVQMPLSLSKKLGNASFRSLLFPYFRPKFFKFNVLNVLYNEFKKGCWFKAFRFSKKFKKSYRYISKRLKFLTFLWKSLYLKKNKFLTYFDLKKLKYVTLTKQYILKNRNKNFFKSRFFTGLTVKHLIRRQHLRNSYNNIMLQYFDEEYEDTPFPFNNEFFFLQVAYGNIFLTRQADRNKILASQRNSSTIVVRERIAYNKAIFRVRTSRLFLFLPFLIKTRNILKNS